MSPLCFSIVCHYDINTSTGNQFWDRISDSNQKNQLILIYLSFIKSHRLQKSKSHLSVSTTIPSQIHTKGGTVTNNSIQKFENHHQKEPPRDIIAEETIKVPETGNEKPAPVSISGEGATASCAVTENPTKNSRNAINTMSTAAAEQIEAILLNPVCSGLKGNGRRGKSC